MSPIHATRRTHTTAVAERLQHVARSDQFLRQHLGPDVNVLVVPANAGPSPGKVDLDKSRTFALLIFLDPSNPVGHWVGLWRMPDKSIHFFDPYGEDVGAKLLFNTIGVTSNGRSVKSRGVSHNMHHYERFGHNIQTCGDWVITRLRHRHLTASQFYSFIVANKKALGLSSFDETAAYLAVYPQQ
jgi:hypothetical protein